ncbi:MAG: hypothetical protein RQ743_03995 [Bacteroidales bacterium]|nr:hypothetical protein [Bacteroidales bacterium]
MKKDTGVSRTWTIIIIAVLFAGMGALAYFLQEKKRAYIASPYGSIPLDAGIIIEAVDMPGLFESLAADNEMIDGMSEIPELQGFTGAIDLVDSLTHKREYGQLAGNNPVLISIHLLGKNRLTPLFSFAASPEIRDKHLRAILDEIPGFGYTQKEYQGSNVYEVLREVTGEASLYLTMVKGVIIISPSGLLVEAGIRQVEQERDIRDLPGFMPVAEAAGKNENKVYILFDNVAKFISLLTGSMNEGPASRLPDLASCLETDLYLNNTGFVMSGYIETRDTSHILYNYRFQEPGSYDIYRYIPASAAMFEIITKPVGKQSVSTPGETRYISDILKAQFTGEMARVYLGIKGQDKEMNKLMLFDLRGSNATEEAFAAELEQYYRREGLSSDRFIIAYKPDAETEYRIYRLPGENLAFELAGDFGKYLKPVYASFYDDVLVLGSARETLSKFIYDNLLSRTLANDLSYREFESTLPSKAGYYFYCAPSGIIPLLEGVVKEGIVDGLMRNSESLRKLQAIGYQFVSSNDMLYNTLSVMYKPEVREEAKAVWESLLDTIAGSKPLFFTNHYTGGSEIFIQDLKNNLYLINSAGRILWKRPVSEAIMGNAYMVDYYRNGKFQILFASKNYLHLIDRNGNNVERYPVQLRSPATNGLALFDYESNMDYRLFICGADRKIYAYDKSGNTVRGWNQFRTATSVSNEVEFFRVSGKDYLVVNDEDNMYILDRRGNVRVEMKEQVSRSDRSMLRLTAGTSPRMILASVDGSIKMVNFNGEVQTYKVSDFSEDPVFEYFDLDADGMGEYIFIDGNTLSAFDDDRSRMFKITLSSDNIIGPYGLEFSSNDRKIGFTDAGADNIYLIDDRGKNLKGFPLKGTSPFSIGKLNRGSTFNLISGGSDSFLYNYEITR